MNTIGHTTLRQKFFQLIQEKKLPQSILLYGLNGIGKKRVALDIVSFLFCTEKTKDAAKLQGCGTCQSCTMIANNNHPDLFLITPTPPKSQQSKESTTLNSDVQSNWTIKTEQLQDTRKKLIHYPLMANHQVIVIDDAERMTSATANSLLKILEEPRPQQIFILITSSLHRVLPTLRSRCAKFFFCGLTEQDIKTIIAHHCEDHPPSAESLAVLIKAFHGSLSHILRAIHSEFDWSLASRLITKQNSFMELSQEIKKIASSDMDLSLLLQCLKFHCLHHAKNNPQTSQETLIFFQKIKDAEKHLSRHIQKEFVLEQLFL